ncbi:MAG: CBS domain-containing protein [Candidatus Sericytochromatia bacterium]|nr:CBS domain-containing protein [Candidatus Tanganyikabacteria bacterium]
MKRSSLELSRRLVVTPFFASHRPTLTRTVGEAMTRDVFVAAPDDPIYDAAALMVASRVSGLPVVATDDRVVGIVTLTDILYRCRTPHGSIADALRDWLGGQGGVDWSKVSGVRVADVMSSPAIVAGPDETLQAAAGRMLERKVDRLPVVEGGRLVGILTRSDIIAELVAWAEQEE